MHLHGHQGVLQARLCAITVCQQCLWWGRQSDMVGSLGPKDREHPRGCLQHRNRQYLCLQVHTGGITTIFLKSIWVKNDPSPLFIPSPSHWAQCVRKGITAVSLQVPSHQRWALAVWDTPHWVARTAMGPIALSVAIIRVRHTNGLDFSPRHRFTNYE